MQPRIYFADLDAYNAGHLRGVWVDFYDGIEADEVQFAIDAMLRDSEGEEWRIDDSEGFAGFTSWDLEKLCEVAALIHQYGEGAVKGFIDHTGADYIFDSSCGFEEIYRGEYESEEDFCQEYFEITERAAEIPVLHSTLDRYIDWESITSDAFISSFFSYEEDSETVHVYSRY
ncbi:antirestriction protein ArdA [Leptolyngbya sp. AN03gr2]|uniref:antirestriction protein ArdA n=1 Tax=Leptolyngbya sp. AN03gr2 TaxID=3423364 RepID=UPI003D311E8A